MDDLRNNKHLIRLYENIKKYNPMKIDRRGRWYTVNLSNLSSYIYNISRKSLDSKKYITALIDWLYKNKLDIMFLYEFVVAAKNNNTYAASLSMALYKRFVRHDINHTTIQEHISLQMETEDTDN